MFHKGQKVVCVYNGWRPTDGVTVPKAGGLYHIRGFMEGYGPRAGRLYLWLEEIVNAPRIYQGGFHEVAFDVKGFRPLTSKPTSIEIFQKMLTPNKVDA